MRPPQRSRLVELADQHSAQGKAGHEAPQQLQVGDVLEARESARITSNYAQSMGM